MYVYNSQVALKKFFNLITKTNLTCNNIPFVFVTKCAFDRTLDPEFIYNEYKILEWEFYWISSFVTGFLQISIKKTVCMKFETIKVCGQWWWGYQQGGKKLHFFILSTSCHFLSNSYLIGVNLNCFILLVAKMI